jgi:hypothetical protein
MRGLLTGTGVVLLWASVIFAHADTRWDPSAGSSPYAQGGGWGPGQDRAGTGGPRPGWESPLPFGSYSAPTHAGPRSGHGDYAPAYANDPGERSPFAPPQGASFDNGLPSQAPPGWFEQFPTGTFRPMETPTRGWDDDPGGYRFRPGEGEGVQGHSPRPSFDPYGYAEPPASAYPSYRFRGDPPAAHGGWQGSVPMDPAYQFRPLNKQELGRMGRDGGWRPVDREPAAPPPPAPGGAWGPGDAFGFEPAPWRGP